MEPNLLIDVTGWLGAVALLSAYALVSAKKLAGDSLRYQALNLLGGGLLIVNSFYYGAFPSVGVNVVWIAIAIVTLVAGRRARG
ncbi:MAG: CBU_0592 family membrane protein [Anaerolineae bacterium]|jgi:hypothetical protein